MRWLIATLVVAVLVAPVGAEAQPAAKAVPRIGFLGNLDAKNQATNVAAFQGGLPDLGWIEDQTVMVDYRWAEGNADRLPGLVAELVQLNLNVMVVAGPLATRAAQRATGTVPIVFAVLLNDPVASGFAAGLARPGGNITGFAWQYEEIVGKHVQLLSEAIPRLSRVVLLRHTAGLPILLTEAEKAARRLGIKPRIVEVTDVAEYEGAFRIAKSERAQAVYVLPSPIFSAHRKRLVELAAQYLPSRGLRAPGICGGGRAPVVRAEHRRHVPARRQLRRSYSQGGQAGGSPHRAGHQIRACHQRENGEGAGTHDPAIVTDARGSPDRMRSMECAAAIEQGALFCNMLNENRASDEHPR